MIKILIFVKKIGKSDWSDMPLEEQQKMINEDAFEAFMAFVSSYQVPNLTKEELDNINSIDEKAISNTLIMITEAGPNVGAEKTAISYN